MKKRWVIVFLIYADFREKRDSNSVSFSSVTEEMRRTLNQMFEDIITVPVCGECARVFVIWNSIAYLPTASGTSESITALYKVDNANNLPENEVTCLGLFPRNDNQMQGNGRAEGQQAGDGSILQDPKQLKEIMNEIGIEESEETLFLTWDHGSGFGIFREDNTQVAELLYPVNQNIVRYPYLAKFWDAAVNSSSALKQLVDDTHRDDLPDGVRIGGARYKLEFISQLFPADKKKSYEFWQLKMHKSIAVQPAPEKVLSKNLMLILNEQTQNLEIATTLSGFRTGSQIEIGRLTVVDIGDILSNSELRHLFEMTLENGQASLVVMMNCWMLNMHTMYSLRSAVQYLVAPQSNIGVPGYNYRAILQFVFDPDRNVTARDVAIECVKTIETDCMRERSKRLRSDGADIIDMWKIFAVDLQAREEEDDSKRLIDRQVEALRHLIRVMIDANGLKGQSLDTAFMYKYTRAVCFDFTRRISMMVDILNWGLSLLYADAFFFLRNDPRMAKPVRDALLAFRNCLLPINKISPLMLCSTGGNSVYEESKDSDAPTAVIGLKPKGYSFFFPLSEFHKGGEHVRLLDNIKNDELLGALPEWKTFLNLYIDPSIDYSTP